MRACQKPIAHN